VTQVIVNGARVWKEFLNPSAQAAVVADLKAMARAAPFRQYETPGGRKLSVRMTAAGQTGWVSDARGYRYDPVQMDGQPWPDIPNSVLSVWTEVSGVERLPDSCLVNFYGEAARMGLHKDSDEADLSWPVVSISLGDDGLFRVGGQDRRGPTQSVWLRSGDVVILSGDARLAYHGIDRIRFGSSGLLPKNGRINVTLRIAG